MTNPTYLWELSPQCQADHPESCPRVFERDGQKFICLAKHPILPRKKAQKETQTEGEAGAQ